MVKPQFESYRYVGEVCRLKSQSIVECRLPGSEINSILAVQAKAVPAECAPANGEVQYGGKLYLSIVYEDGSRNVCRAERGIEFFHKKEGELITPACFARALLEAENITWRREGSGLYISTVIGAELTVYGTKQMEYLLGGENLVVKKQTEKIYKTVCVSGEVEGEDEFDTDYVGDILLHSEKAVVNRVHASAGQIDVEGEINVHLCVMKKEGNLCSYERLIPFKSSIPSEEAFGKLTASARAFVKSANLTADTDEEKGNSRMVLSYALSLECYLSVQDEITVAKDAFSPKAEITLQTQKDGGMYLSNHEKRTERVSGTAVVSPEIEGEYGLQAAVLPRVEISFRKGERGMEAEGAVLAELLLCSPEGNHRTATLSLPFAFSLETDAEHIEADCMVCGLNVRRKKSGETEAEATIRLSLRTFERREWSYIVKAEAGEPHSDGESAFSVFMTRVGEELWEVSKRLHCPPEELVKSNPELTFPLKEGERIFVYRQIGK